MACPLHLNEGPLNECCLDVLRQGCPTCKWLGAVHPTGHTNEGTHKRAMPVWAIGLLGCLPHGHPCSSTLHLNGCLVLLAPLAPWAVSCYTGSLLGWVWEAETSKGRESPTATIARAVGEVVAGCHRLRLHGLHAAHKLSVGQPCIRRQSLPQRACNKYKKWKGGRMAYNM